MQILFISNYLNHHQLPFNLELSKKEDVEYYFIATERTPKFRLELGYEEMNDKYDFVIKEYECENKKTIEDLILSADVVICGSAPDKLIKKRISSNKLTFKCSERFYKKEPISIFDKTKSILGNYIHYKRFDKYNFHLLCCSAYTSQDVNRYFNFKGKCYKWGYFVDVIKYQNINEIINKKKKNSILWVGRFIDWKHPEYAIMVAKELKLNGYKFELNLIGTGELEGNIKKMITDQGLYDYVHVLGPMKPDKVREYMRDSEIFIFTSDRNEGWGAVLNESMNSACAVVASHMIGAVPFLLKHNHNGLVYRDGDFEDFYEKITWLLNNDINRKTISKNAYLTMIQEWNPDNAAKKFIELSSAVLNGIDRPDIFDDGICSKAIELKDQWF